MPRSVSPHLRQPLIQRPQEDDAEEAHSHRQSCDDDGFPSEDGLVVKATAAMYSFAILGIFTSSIGVMLPRIEAFYKLNDVQASLCFLAGPFGYVMAAQFNEAIHRCWGRRGVAVLGPIAHIVSAAVIATHPPFLLVVASITLTFAGVGLLDGSWCTWAAGQKNANFVSGLLHGSFSVGAGFGPMAIELVLNDSDSWYTWYGILACVCMTELAVLAYVFWSEDSTKYCEAAQDGSSDQSRSNLSQMFAYKATWLCACYLLVDVGTEAAISGWVVTYMLRIRQSSPRLASLCSSGFWTGMAVSRMVLGYVSDRFGVRRTTAIYITCALFCQILFILVEGPAVSAMLITLVGFFTGPMFPSAIIRLTQLLPRALGVGAVSFVASVGQLGGALLPFGLGALSQMFGLGIFGVIIIGQFAVCLVLWLIFS